MSSTKEDGTAAATAQQLGSMSLGKSAERKGEPETKNEDDTNGTPTKKLCSKCGKESDTLKKCTACKCVWYCDKDCQNRHWKEHKKECKVIKKELQKRGGKLDLGNELDLGPLPDLPPRDECPICMRVVPIDSKLQAYAACCGKIICSGCNFQHEFQARKANAERVQMEQTPVPRTCAFCREPIANSEEELVARVRKRVELNDPRAMLNLAMAYGFGRHGLPVDQAKCIDLLRQSAGLGCVSAQCQLGSFYRTGDMGLEQNEEEGLSHWKEAAEGGCFISRNNLGSIEGRNGDHAAAMRHLRFSAAGGFRISMGILISCFEDGQIHHGDLAETLQAMYRSKAEMKSENRDEHIKHLKKTGEWYRWDYEQCNC